MTKPVTGLVIFGNSAGPDHTGDLDSNYAALQTAINDFATYSNRLTDTSGSPNTITAAIPASTTFVLADGVMAQVRVANTNTLSVVNANINGTGNVLVTNPDGSGLVAGQLAAGGVYMLMYESVSGHYQLMGSTGVTGLGNPTALVGLAAINGTANTAMRSDGAPALNPGISPTWTGTHIFNGATFVTNGTTGVSIGQDGGLPKVEWINSAAAADQKLWDQYIDSNTMHRRTINDARTVGTDFEAIVRSAGVASSMSYGNTSSNPTWSQLGTGTAQFNGLLQAKDQAGNFNDVGWRDLPSNSQAGNYTAILGDRGKLIIMTGAGTTATIPSNASVGYPVGTVLTGYNGTGGTLSVAINTDSLFLAGVGTTGTRSVGLFGYFVAIKILSTSWIISGPAVT